MRTIIVASIACMMLTGCPSGSQQKAAQASENAAIIVQNLQQAEIAAYNSGDIPQSDHVFIEQSVATIGQAGKTADSCIANANSNAAIVTCISAVVNSVSAINAEGGTYLKSATAKTDFNLAMTGVESLMQAIIAMEGGTAQ